MNLTDKEIKQVIEDLRKYPKGISARYWGYGPLEANQTKEGVSAPKTPSDVTLYECLEYG